MTVLQCGEGDLFDIHPGKSVREEKGPSPQELFGFAEKIIPYFGDCPFGLSVMSTKNMSSPRNTPVIGKWH
jgi:hypothetical protein